MIARELCSVLAEDQGRIALVCGAQRISRGDLAARVEGLGRALHDMGVCAGDLVLLVLPNCPEFVVSYFATAWTGAAVLALDPGLKEQEFRSYLERNKPRVVIAAAAVTPRLGLPPAAAGDGPSLVQVGPGAGWGIPFDRLVHSGLAQPRGVAGSPDADAPWVIAYSSGSTGEPKRICRSQGNQLAEAAQIIASASITPDDTILCPVPLFHALGQFCCMIVAVLAGATLVLLDPGRVDSADGRRLDIEEMVRLIREYRVSVMPCVPYILEALADWPAEREADLSSLRLCLSGSNFLPQLVRERFFRRFGVPVRQTYGSSEAGSVSWDCDPEEWVPESVGRPLRGVRVEIVDERGVPLPVGSVGEIVVSGPSVMLGETGPDQQLMRPGNGRLHTGDLGLLGEDGRLYLTGRKRVLVDIGGRKVNPVEVEAVLEGHPQVSSAAAVGLPGEGGGDLLAAAVVPAGAVDATELLEYCRERLADYKVPLRIEFVERIPRSPLGKVLRAQLAASLSAQPESAPLLAADRTEAPLPDRADVWAERNPTVRRGLIAKRLRRCVASVLGRVPDDIDAATPLQAQGLDSLGALRLRMAVQESLGRLVGLPELLGGASLDWLTERLTVELADVALPLVAAGSRRGEFPLSRNQLAIWHADSIAPESAVYNESHAWRIRSAVDPEVLRRGFRSLVDRHPVFRTTFGMRDGKPLQRVADRAEADFAIVPVPEQWNRYQDELSAEAFRPFNLERELPIRARLYHGDAQGPVLLLTVHHIVSDYWSLVVMLQELEAILAAGQAGGEMYRPAPRYTYADYVRWQEEALAGPLGERDWAYWRARLAELPPALDFTLAKRRPVVRFPHGATYFRELGEKVVLALREFARSRGLTVYNVLLAAFQLFMHLQTGERDIAVGVITTNRQRAEFADVLGYFINPVVCRVGVDPDASFIELAQASAHELHQGMEHQLLPFQTIVERLGLVRDRSRAPLVEIAFGQNKAHDPSMQSLSRFLAGGESALRVGPLTLERIVLRQRGVVYDFSGAVYEAADSVAIAWEYNSGLFEPDTVERMAIQYEALVAEVLRNPGNSLGTLQTCGPAERALIVASSRGGPADGGTMTLCDAVRDQAIRTPDRLVLRAGATGLSYRDLWARARGFSARLAAVGLARGDAALLSLPYGSDLVVAGLAVLLVGGVCVPVAPDVVGGAAAVGAEQRRARVLITTADRRASFGPWSLPVLCPDETADGEALASWLPEAVAAPGDPALVMREPGAQGTGSAVVHDHHTLLSWARWLGTYLDPDHELLVYGGQTADVILARMLAVAACGGTAESAPETVTSGELAVLLGSGRPFGVVELTPGQLAPLLGGLTAGGLRPKVHALVIAGDTPLPVSLARRWREAVKPERLVYAYGSVRTAPVVSAWDLPADLPADLPLSAGQPLPGIDRWVLDAQGRPAPVGVPGEICVTSSARPWHANSFPAENFVSRASPGTPGSPLLRTGDLGCYLPEGGVALLGRAEDNIRVRGYRVSRVIVETALLEMPQVADAAVAFTGESPERRVTAYVAVADDDADELRTSRSLRDELRNLLPEYSLPSEIVVTRSLPRGADGRIDRSRLADAVNSVTRAPAESPAWTPMEQHLAAIWTDVLDVSQVTPQDDYFELDGDSITAMRIVSRAADVGIRITPRQIFSHPVLRELAAVAVATRATEQGQQAETALRAVPVDIPLAPVQRWFLEQDFARSDWWNQAVLLQAARGLDRSLLVRALQAVAEHHPAFRFRFRRTAGGWSQTEEPGAEALALIDRSGSPREVATELHSMLRLDSGSLLAGAIVDGSDAGLRLLLAAHHMVIDFVSWQILIEDLERACGQLGAGERIQLQPATSGYGEWTRALTAHADSEAMRSECEYWSRNPAGQWTAARPGPERLARTAAVSMTAADTAAFLAATGGQNRGSAPDVVLAAVALALAEYAGARMIRIDVEDHGRDEIAAGLDVTRTVGWFTSIYPLLVDIPAGAGPAETYRIVTEARRQVPGRGRGYGLLRYAASDTAVRRRMAVLPAAAVNFNYLGRMGQLMRGAGPAEKPGSRLLWPLPLGETADRHPENARPYSLEISALLSSGKLSLRMRHDWLDTRGGSADDLLARVLQGVSAIVSAGQLNDLTGAKHV